MKNMIKAFVVGVSFVVATYGQTVSQNGGCKLDNPQSGALVHAYVLDKTGFNRGWKETQKMLTTFLEGYDEADTKVDMNEEGFSLKEFRKGGIYCDCGKWEGYYKVSTNGLYRFRLQQAVSCNYPEEVAGFAMRVNDTNIVVSEDIRTGQTNKNITMRQGWNKIEVICRERADSNRDGNYPLTISLGMAGRPGEIKLVPSMLCH